MGRRRARRPETRRFRPRVASLTSEKRPKQGIRTVRLGCRTLRHAPFRAKYLFLLPISLTRRETGGKPRALRLGSSGTGQRSGFCRDLERISPPVSQKAIFVSCGAKVEVAVLMDVAEHHSANHVTQRPWCRSPVRKNPAVLRHFARGLFELRTETPRQSPNRWPISPPISGGHFPVLWVHLGQLLSRSRARAAGRPSRWEARSSEAVSER